MHWWSKRHFHLCPMMQNWKDRSYTSNSFIYYKSWPKGLELTPEPSCADGSQLDSWVMHNWVTSQPELSWAEPRRVVATLSLTHLKIGLFLSTTRCRLRCKTTNYNVKATITTVRDWETVMMRKPWDWALQLKWCFYLPIVGGPNSTPGV
jgi:hypothetical protein